MDNTQIINNQKGTSLLELLVAITLFAVIMLSATQIFKMVIDGQRNALSAQNVQENMRYAMEKMSREIRMAQISKHSCDSTFSSGESASYKVFNVFTDSGNDKLYFKNQYGDCVAYYLENNRLKIRVSAGAATNEGFITPSKIQVSNLKFNAVDDQIDAFHSIQPYVTMMMDIKAVGPGLHEQKMKLQITISSRYYE